MAPPFQRTPAVYCVRLGQALVDDYCGLVPGSVQTLRQIFSASPRFCCQFITAVTMRYDMSSGERLSLSRFGPRGSSSRQAGLGQALLPGGGGLLDASCGPERPPLLPDDLIPPPDLLEMVVSWIFEDPRLILITFLNTPIAASLPIGFLELTPLSGLICWCIKAPLAYKRRKPPLPAPKEPPAQDCQALYSKLHLSVLQVLMMLQGHLTEKKLYGRLGLVPFEHVVSLGEDLGRLADELNPLSAAQETELALDRLAQALQVAMASGALLCTRGREGGWGRLQRLKGWQGGERQGWGGRECCPPPPNVVLSHLSPCRGPQDRVLQAAPQQVRPQPVRNTQQSWKQAVLRTGLPAGRPLPCAAQGQPAARPAWAQAGRLQATLFACGRFTPW